jgi:hypothetical protein
VEALLFFLILLIGNSVLPVLLPWYIIVPINFFAVFPFKLKNSLAFWLAGFASGLVWLFYSLWISHNNQHILAQRLTKVIMLPFPVMLFMAEFFIPFFVGGISALTGSLFKKFITTNAK